MDLLGGKSGKLKCECGNLRYRGAKLCSDCYFSKVRYYVFNGLYSMVSGFEGSNINDKVITLVVKALSEIEAITKIDSINKWEEWGNYCSAGFVSKSKYLNDIYTKKVNDFCIAGTLEAFKTMNEVRNYIKEKGFTIYE